MRPCSDEDREAEWVLIHIQSTCWQGMLAGGLLGLGLGLLLEWVWWWLS